MFGACPGVKQALFRTISPRMELMSTRNYPLWARGCGDEEPTVVLSHYALRLLQTVSKFRLHFSRLCQTKSVTESGYFDILYVCVYVCVCVRARARVCVCMCVKCCLFPVCIEAYSAANRRRVELQLTVAVSL